MAVEAPVGAEPVVESTPAVGVGAPDVSHVPDWAFAAFDEPVAPVVVGITDVGGGMAVEKPVGAAPVAASTPAVGVGAGEVSHVPDRMCARSRGLVPDGLVDLWRCKPGARWGAPGTPPEEEEEEEKTGWGGDQDSEGDQRPELVSASSSDGGASVGFTSWFSSDGGATVGFASSSNGSPPCSRLT